MENVIFWYKTAPSEANIKTWNDECKMELYKEIEFCPVTNLFFWKFCLSLRTSYKELNWCANNPNVQIHTVC